MRHARGRPAHRSQLLFGSAGTQVLIALVLAFTGLLTTLAPQGPSLTLAPQEAAAQGEVWAYGGELVDYTGGIHNTTCPGGIWMGSPTGGSAEVVLGAPDDRDISLGWGGSVTIKFERPARGSGDSDPDVFVWELGMGEVYDVYVSEDGGTYTWVGQATPLEPGQQGFDVDHAGFDEDSRINYIRVMDSQPGRDPMSCYLFEGENYSQDGVDIDAVGVLTPAPFAALTLDKVSDVEDGEPVAVDDEIEYTFIVENTGNVDLTGVTVTDPLPGLSAITPASADIAEGESQTFTATYTVTQADVDAGEIVNEATATGNPPQGYVGDPPSDTDDETVTVEQEAALEIVKTADTDGPVNVGDDITYTFEVTNTGNVTLTDVTVTDPMAGLSPIDPESVDELAPGATAQFTATYTATEADIIAGSVENTATATGIPPESCVDCDPPTATDDETVPTVDPGLAIVKTSDVAAGESVTEGDTVTYTFTVTNTGDVALTGVTVNDDLDGLSAIAPASADIPVEGSATFTATYVVTAADVDAGSIENSATATGACGDGCTTTSDPDEETVTVEEPVTGIAIDKTSDVAFGETIAADDTVTYFFDVTNTGDVPLTDVTVADPLDGLSWVDGPTVAALAPGATVTLSATYVVTEADVLAGRSRGAPDAGQDCRHRRPGQCR